MKILPLGKQNFEDIIRKDLLYIDKTEQIYKLIQKDLYFLSRPRRFGKSLLISKFKYLFEGRKDLFKDLYIGQHTDYDFPSFPVVHFNFASFGHKVENLEAILKVEIEQYANQYNIQTEKVSLGKQLESLIKGITEQNKPVVILIDEYDKPIIDFITEVDKAKANRKILRDFFSPLKELDFNGHLKFLFITGISKFSKVSLFSDLNNLIDLSVDNPLSNDLLGITHKELSENFQPHLEVVSKRLKVPKAELLTHIKNWYNGYSYDGEIKLCNPFSLLNFFQAQRFGNFWFATGTPTFLVETIRNERIVPAELEDIEVSDTFFAKFSIEHLDIVGLLYQTGYLTIKSVERSIYETRYYLGYPNIEVQKSLEHNLVEAFTFKPSSTVSNALLKMQRGLKTGDLDLFMRFLKTILSNLKYNWQPPKQYKDEDEIFKMWEGYFHAILYVITSYMNFSVKAEVATNKGHVDLIAETDNFIYLMEFKLDGTSTDAITQIKNREYATNYQNAIKKVFLVGVNFSEKERNVESWESEVWA